MDQASEADFRCLAGFRGLQLQLGSFLEGEHAGNNVVGEFLPEDVVAHDTVVIGLAREGNPVFGAGQFFHQLLYGFVGLEVRVVLGNRVEIGQGLGQQVFGATQALDLGAVAGVSGGIFLSADGVVSGFHHLGEGGFFMIHIRLGGFHQVGNQVVPALQLHINLCEPVLELVAQRYQLVVDKNQVENDNGNNNKADDSGSHDDSLEG